MEGENHTFCNVLRELLLQLPKVKTAAYVIEHPMLGNPKIYVETVKKRRPKTAFKKAAESLIALSEEFKTKLQTALKKQ